MSIENLNPFIKRLAIIITILLFALAITLGSHLFNSSGRADMEETAPASFVHKGDKIIIPDASALRSRLTIQKVTVKDSPYVVSLPAAVEADPARTINVLPPVAGRVVKLLVRLGDYVVKNQPLAVIDSGDLAQAYADDEKASDALHLAESTLKRMRGLREAGAGALKDLEQAESDYVQAKAEFIRAEARLKELGVSSHPEDGARLLTLTAPTTGNIITLTTAPGSFVNDTTASLMTIANLDTVWVTANVPENYIAFVSDGQLVDVTFSAYPGQVFHGRVSFISQVVEPDTHRDKVRIAFENSAGKFKPNMFATATFNVPQKSAVFVPNSALLMDNDNTTVFVEVAPWTFVRRTVLPGYGEGDDSRIDKGLNPGDRIIVKGGVLLND